MSLDQVGIDIIIPIYNAFNDLVTCIDSVKAHTNLNCHRLILINDASTDSRIAPYLDSLSEENIMVIHNTENCGFSHNINKGIRLSDKDVILLNSDTIVTDRWIEKILACAYSNEKIGTVTPLSNNATLCSVPDFCKENSLPEGISLNEYANLIESISLKKYPVIPVANGFCMFIKRCVFHDIGLFDAETFGRGYGEENDFCYRAQQAGYFHVMCDDTYIYHSGTESFESDEKRKYIKTHEKILDQRYPEQMRAVRIHCHDNPNCAVFENIRLNTALKNGHKNILYLVQADFRKDSHDNIGGTQLHVKDLCENLRYKENIFVVARNSNYLNLTIYINDEEYYLKFYIGETPEFPIFRNRDFALLYGKILDYCQIDIVHIHHTLGLSLELFYQARERQIPVVTTLHDYYVICPTIKLLNKEDQFCKGIADEAMCHSCLHSRCGIYPKTDYIRIWRREYLKALEMTECIFVPSQAAREIISEYFPSLTSKMVVITHGSAPVPHLKDENGKDSSLSSTFNVAFIGGISTAKGSYCSSQLVKNGPPDIKWHLFGIFGHNDLSVVNRPNFIKTGSYQREELPALLENYKIDVICILPIWPETFCYTLSEAVLCGVPVIATDIGALGERVKELQCGWLVPYHASFSDILEVINNIKDRGKEYQHKKQNAQQAKIRTIEEMCEDYHHFYQSNIKESFSLKTDPLTKEWFIDQYLLTNGLGGNDTLSLSNRLEEAERQLWDVYHSTTYRMVQIIGGLKIPFKKQLKEFMFQLYRLLRLERQ